MKGSAYANMKELRFEATDGEWRAAFAFDPRRQAIVLVAADKSGGSEKKFYKQLIDKADARYGQHLERLKAEERVTMSIGKVAGKTFTKKGKKR